jgi:endonuclease/exonuclease/phosphatase (EEP) superfamily protein YafD
MSKNIIVASANTHESRMLRHPDGLSPFTAKAADVLLLQEVLGMEENEVSNRLGADNFELVHCVPALGLAIAISKDSGARVEQEMTDTTILHRTTRLERVLKFSQASYRLRERGMLGARLKFGPDTELTVATTHPIIFIRSISRGRQVTAMGNALCRPFYDTERLIVGGDMNHYPGPRKVDIKAQHQAHLDRVTLDAPSWCIEGSRHEWIARLGSFATGKALNSFDAELDAILYRGVIPIASTVVDICSDHKAIIAEFQVS